MSDKNKFANATMYRDTKSSILVIGPLLVIIIIYAAFFLAASIMKPLSPATPLNEAFSFDEDTRTISLLEATYSPSQELMEVKLQLHNNDFDGIEKYVYEAHILRGNMKKLEVKEIVHSDIITVIQIHHLKPRFKELTLYLAPQLDEILETNMTAVVVTEENYTAVNSIDTLQLPEYLLARLQLTADQLTREIEEAETQITSKEKEIASIRKKNADLEESKVFFTSEEVLAVDAEIASNKNHIEQLAGEINTLNESVSLNRVQLKETNELIAARKAEIEQKE